ncbi:MAG: NAD(P)/FAD-dependent oxidoreductase [Chloroflexi bacterium]|nr:NAD(P)/FAD-dependent oxidoreductase [Chloroflexota bacterium]
MEQYDVAVIGGGVVGCAIARELSRFRLKVALLEKEADVCRGTSGKNSAVVHTGFNVKTGSLKARLNVAGARMFEEYCAELDVPFKRVGKLVIALSEAEVPDLAELKATGDANGVPSLELIDGATIRKMEPNISGVAALNVPTAAITSPFHLTIALAEAAAANGATVMLQAEVTAISSKGGAFRLTTRRGAIESKLVINSAGIYADHVARLAGVRRYRVYPCRGQYFIIDKAKGDLIKRMVYPVPPKGGSGLGVHLTPTVDGNILIGPSAEYVRRKDDVSTTRAVARQLLKEAQQLLPAITPRDVIAAYAGLRAKTTPSSVGGFGDFIIEEAEECQGMLHLIGIESPGLTAAPAIALEAAGWVGKYLPLVPNGHLSPKHNGAVPFRDLPPERQAELVAQDSDYGRIVCRCETVTRKEVKEAIENPLGARSLNSIKYRARVTMGRCQGGFCGPRVVDMLLQEYNVPLPEINLKGPGSSLFTGEVKGLRKPCAQK